MQKQWFRFERLVINREREIFENIKYFPQVLKLYIKYLRYLEDDFSVFRISAAVGMVELIERTSPHFYLVLSQDEVCGFFCLENPVGIPNKLYSAQVVTCFDRKYWGTFTKYAGRIFEDYCFNVLGLRKIKALVYPENTRVKALLNTCGFKKEALLKGETLKKGKMQDIEIYSVNKEEKCN